MKKRKKMTVRIPEIGERVYLKEHGWCVRVQPDDELEKEMRGMGTEVAMRNGMGLLHCYNNQGILIAMLESGLRRPSVNELLQENHIRMFSALPVLSN